MEQGLLAGYLRREDLARELKKSVRTLDRWETRRMGPPRVVVGRTILYSIETVRAWLQSREQRRGPLHMSAGTRKAGQGQR